MADESQYTDSESEINTRENVCGNCRWGEALPPPEGKQPELKKDSWLERFFGDPLKDAWYLDRWYIQNYNHLNNVSCARYPTHTNQAKNHYCGEWGERA